jgi:DNA-binding beta-propeller fold protein YncE
MFIVLFGLVLASGSFAVTGDVEKSYPAPYSCPTGMAAGGGFLYLADCKSDQIYKIDSETGEVVSEFGAPGFRPQGLAYDGKYLWLVDVEYELIYQIDPETQVSVKTIWCPV